MTNGIKEWTIFLKSYIFTKEEIEVKIISYCSKEFTYTISNIDNRVSDFLKLNKLVRGNCKVNEIILELFLLNIINEQNKEFILRQELLEINSLYDITNSDDIIFFNYKKFDPKKNYINGAIYNDNKITATYIEENSLLKILRKISKDKIKNVKIIESRLKESLNITKSKDTKRIEQKFNLLGRGSITGYNKQGKEIQWYGNINYSIEGAYFFVKYNNLLLRLNSELVAYRKIDDHRAILICKSVLIQIESEKSEEFLAGLDLKLGGQLNNGKVLKNSMQKYLNNNEIVERIETFVHQYINISLLSVDTMIGCEAWLQSVLGKRIINWLEFPIEVNRNDVDLINISELNIEIKLLLKLIIKKFNIPIRDKAYIYLLIWNSICRFNREQLSKSWEEYFGKYFNDKIISKDNFKEYVRRYTQIYELNISNLLDENNIIRFIQYLIHKKLIREESLSGNYIRMKLLLPQYIEERKIEMLEKRLCLVKECKSKKYTINDIDLMNGLEFEKFIMNMFTKLGYSARLTKATGDQGIDVIAEKDNKQLGIQTKCYSCGKIGNSAVQQVVAGINFYKLDKGIVITNQYFTEAAYELAQANSIILWDRKMLKERLIDL